MKGFRTYIIALFLITVINFTNRLLVKRKNGNLKGYDRQEAYAIDVFACFNYRTFWKKYLTDNSESAYWPKEFGESISSAMGENILRGTISKKGRKGLLSSWFYGERLSEILNKSFREPAHCVDARKSYLEKQKQI